MQIPTATHQAAGGGSLALLQQQQGVGGAEGKKGGRIAGISVKKSYKEIVIVPTTPEVRRASQGYKCQYGIKSFRIKYVLNLAAHSSTPIHTHPHPPEGLSRGRGEPCHGRLHGALR